MVQTPRGFGEFSGAELSKKIMKKNASLVQERCNKRDYEYEYTYVVRAVQSSRTGSCFLYIIVGRGKHERIIVRYQVHGMNRIATQILVLMRSNSSFISGSVHER